MLGSLLRGAGVVAWFVVQLLLCVSVMVVAFVGLNLLVFLITGSEPR